HRLAPGRGCPGRSPRRCDRELRPARKAGPRQLRRTASALDHGPGGEGQVRDPEVLDHPTLLTEARPAAPGLLGSDHAYVLGPGDEERAGVEVAGTGDRVHLERRPARVGQLDGVAVVDDALEDRQGPDPHQPMGVTGLGRTGPACNMRPWTSTPRPCSTASRLPCRAGWSDASSGACSTTAAWPTAR